MTRTNPKGASMPSDDIHIHKSVKNASLERFFKTNNLVVLLVLSLFIGVLIGAAIFYPAGKRYKLASSVALATYSTGQVVKTSHFDIKVSDISYDSVGKEPFKPAKNNRFLIFNLYLKNKTNSEMPVFPSNQTVVKDDQGNTYRMIVAKVSKPFQAGHLPPGDNIQGQIAFEIPTTLEHPTLFFDSGWPDSNVSIRF